VNDVPSGKIVPLGYFGLPGAAPPQGPAFFQKLRAGLAMDSPVYSSPSEQGGIGRIDDGVYLLAGNVSLEDLKVGWHISLSKNKVTSGNSPFFLSGRASAPHGKTMWSIPQNGPPVLRGLSTFAVINFHPADFCRSAIFDLEK
jgi:hypothetical protein